MMAILASGRQLTRAVAHLGGLGIQLLDLSLASFALQLIIVALAIWHCIHFIATPELEPGQRQKLGTLSCCHEGNIVTGDIHCVLWK